MVFSRDSSSAGTSLRWLYAISVLCVVAALAVLGTALVGRFGFPLDDSWIHQSVARNLAMYGSLGYLPHQRSSGSTSFLWTLLLSVNYILLRPVMAPAFALVVNAGCLAGTVLLSLRLAVRDRMPTAWALLWALAPLANGNFVWLAFTGMEHLLFVFLSVLSIALWADAEVPAGVAGLAMGLLAMTRPEGIVLPVLLLGWNPARRRSNALAIAGVVAVLLAAVPFAVNLWTSHTLLPLTFKGRQFLYFGGEPHFPGAQVGLLLAWFHRLLLAFLAPDPGATGTRARLIAFGVSLLLTLLCGLGLLSLARDRCRLTLLVFSWGLLHSCLYLLLLPTTGHGGRYQPFLLMLETPLAARGIFWLAERLRPRQAIAMTLPAIAVALFAGCSWRLWRATLLSGVSHIEGSHGVMAGHLIEHLPGRTVAVFDIGRIGYEYQGQIVDLGGLTDTGYVRYLLDGRVPEYLRQHRIEYVVLPTDFDRGSRLADTLKLPHNSQVALEPLFRACSPRTVWALGYLETSNAFQCQELDRLRFAGGDRSAGQP